MNKLIGVLILGLIMVVGFGSLFFFCFEKISVMENNLNYLTNVLEVKGFDGVKFSSSGLFDSKTGNILIETSGRSNFDVCESFLHELKHSIDFKNSVFVEKTVDKYEVSAREYVKEFNYLCGDLE